MAGLTTPLRIRTDFLLGGEPRPAVLVSCEAFHNPLLPFCEGTSLVIADTSDPSKANDVSQHEASIGVRQSVFEAFLTSSAEIASPPILTSALQTQLEALESLMALERAKWQEPRLRSALARARIPNSP